MNRPIVKVCGVTRPEEVACLAEHRVDFFGLVVGLPSPWSVSPERAAELAACVRPALRPTLVTGLQPVEELLQLVDQTRALAIQLGMVATPEHVRQLRQKFAREQLTIIQEISYTQGRFAKESQVEEFLAAGADFILLDRLAKFHSGVAARDTIPPDGLSGFRRRHPQAPILVAGGVSAANVRLLVAASGAAGIDVCTSLRTDGVIDRQRVAELAAEISTLAPAASSAPPPLSDFLRAAPPGKQVIAYLTIGDPPGRFVEVACELLNSGALTLELGFPHAQPQEGATLLASHQRALGAGVNTAQALDFFGEVARAHPQTPLIAVVQWPAISGAEELPEFLDGLAAAGGRAVLPVGLPLWRLPALASQTESRDLQIVLPCPPNTTRTFRSIAWRYCTGGIYVPRGRTTGGSQSFGNVDQFCHELAQETDLPIIVGVGINKAEDVSAVCQPPVKAAAVGSALVAHISAGGSPSEFLRALLQ